MKEQIITSYNGKTFTTFFDSEEAEKRKKAIENEIDETNRLRKTKNIKVSVVILLVALAIIVPILLIDKFIVIDKTGEFLICFVIAVILTILFVIWEALCKPMVSRNDREYPIDITLYEICQGKKILKLKISNNKPFALTVITEDEDHFVKEEHVGVIEEKINTAARDISLDLHNGVLIVPYRYTCYEG